MKKPSREKASEFLDSLVRSAASDDPSPDQLRRLERAMAPLLNSPPVDPPLPENPVAPAGTGLLHVTAGKVALAVAAAAATGGGYWLLSSRHEPPPPPPPVSAPPSPSSAPPPPSPPPAPSTQAGDRTQPPAQPHREKDHRRTVDLQREAKLLEKAQAALSSNDPVRALAIAGDHLRLYPRGALAQERERIAIEALVRSKRREEARRRADAFERNYPTSVQAPRIRQLVDDHE